MLNSPLQLSRETRPRFRKIELQIFTFATLWHSITYIRKMISKFSFECWNRCIAVLITCTEITEVSTFRSHIRKIYRLFTAVCCLSIHIIFSSVWTGVLLDFPYKPVQWRIQVFPVMEVVTVGTYVNGSCPYGFQFSDKQYWVVTPYLQIQAYGPKKTTLAMPAGRSITISRQGIWSEKLAIPIGGGHLLVPGISH